MPLRARNTLFLTAGLRAGVSGSATWPHPKLPPKRGARSTWRRMGAHAPFPALAVDRHWHMLAANAAIAPLIAGVLPALLEPPVNVLRPSLHPEGLAPRIENIQGEWRAHLLDRLGRQAVGDAATPRSRRCTPSSPRYPRGEAGAVPDLVAGEIAVPLRLRDGDGAELAFISHRHHVRDGRRHHACRSCRSRRSIPADPETAAYVRGWEG